MYDAPPPCATAGGVLFDSSREGKEEKERHAANKIIRVARI